MKMLSSLTLLVLAAGILVGARPAGAAEIDGRIEKSFKQTYVYRTYLAKDAVTITSKDGKVILSGTVAEQSHKAIAQDAAEALPDVLTVDNRIVVTGKDSDERSDMWIRSRIRMMLLYHRNVSPGNTDIDVKDGVVTLHGTARNQAEKELTTEYAKDVDGVKDVRNEMTVAAAPKDGKIEARVGEVGDAIDDASIVVQVKGILLFHRSTSAVRTKVHCKDGVVTLTGKAKNSAERDLVGKLTQDVNGVLKVVNEMTVEAPGSTG